MFKNILVFLDDSEEAQRGLELAVSLARLSSGRVRGLFVKRLIVPEISTWSPGPEMGVESPGILDPALVAELEAEQEKAAVRVTESFYRWVGEEPQTLEVVRGDLVEQLLTASRAADLVVMGRGWSKPEMESRWLSEITRRVLKKTWAPVLIPPVTIASPFSGPYLLAYDGSRAANWSLRQVASLAALTGAALTVLAVGDSEVTAERLQEARTYLQPYGLAVNLESRAGKPAAVIQALVQEHRFTLMALGAHGHRRIKEIFLGTTTDKLLHELPLAFLICAS